MLSEPLWSCSERLRDAQPSWAVVPTRSNPRLIIVAQVHVYNPVELLEVEQEKLVHDDMLREEYMVQGGTSNTR